MKPQFKVGDKVSWDYTTMRHPKLHRTGSGTITQVFAAFGNMPTNYSVTGANRVLFEDEIKLCQSTTHTPR